MLAMHGVSGLAKAFPMSHRVLSWMLSVFLLAELSLCKTSPNLHMNERLKEETPPKEAFFPAAYYELKEDALRDVPDRYAPIIAILDEKLRNIAVPYKSSDSSGCSDQWWINGPSAKLDVNRVHDMERVTITKTGLKVDAAYDVQVTVPAYFQARHKFLFWCIRKDICHGDVKLGPVRVTVSIVLDVTWNEEQGSIDVKGTPTIVIPPFGIPQGCHIPWWATLFVNVNDEERKVIEEATATVEKNLKRSLTVPTWVDLWPGAGITYWVDGAPAFTEGQSAIIRLKAAAVAHDALSGKHVWYQPTEAERKFQLPNKWDPTPSGQRMLNGLRVTSTFFTATQMLAQTSGLENTTVSNPILDAMLTTHYELYRPTFAVPSDGEVKLEVPRGEIFVNCSMLNGTEISKGDGPPRTILAAWFANLTVSGTIGYTNDSAPGLYPILTDVNQEFDVGIDVAPIPVEDAFARGLLRDNQGKLIEVLNDFAAEHPWVLPEQYRPYLPRPTYKLRALPDAGHGLGVVDMLSYCFCEGDKKIRWSKCGFECKTASFPIIPMASVGFTPWNSGVDGETEVPLPHGEMVMVMDPEMGEVSPMGSVNEKDLISVVFGGGDHYDWNHGARLGDDIAGIALPSTNGCASMPGSSTMTYLLSSSEVKLYCTSSDCSGCAVQGERLQYGRFGRATISDDGGDSQEGWLLLGHVSDQASSVVELVCAAGLMPHSNAGAFLTTHGYDKSANFLYQGANDVDSCNINLGVPWTFTRLSSTSPGNPTDGYAKRTCEQVPSGYAFVEETDIAMAALRRSYIASGDAEFYRAGIACPTDKCEGCASTWPTVPANTCQLPSPEVGDLPWALWVAHPDSAMFASCPSPPRDPSHVSGFLIWCMGGLMLFTQCLGVVAFLAWISRRMVKSERVRAAVSYSKEGVELGANKSAEGVLTLTDVIWSLVKGNFKYLSPKDDIVATILVAGGAFLLCTFAASWWFLNPMPNLERSGWSDAGDIDVGSDGDSATLGSLFNTVKYESAMSHWRTRGAIISSMGCVLLMSWIIARHILPFVPKQKKAAGIWTALAAGAIFICWMSLFGITLFSLFQEKYVDLISIDLGDSLSDNSTSSDILNHINGTDGIMGSVLRYGSVLAGSASTAYVLSFVGNMCLYLIHGSVWGVVAAVCVFLGPGELNRRDSRACRCCSIKKLQSAFDTPEEMSSARWRVEAIGSLALATAAFMFPLLCGAPVVVVYNQVGVGHWWLVVWGAQSLLPFCFLAWATQPQRLRVGLRYMYYVVGLILGAAMLGMLLKALHWQATLRETGRLEWQLPILLWITGGWLCGGGVALVLLLAGRETVARVAPYDSMYECSDSRTDDAEPTECGSFEDKDDDLSAPLLKPASQYRRQPPPHYCAAWEQSAPLVKKDTDHLKLSWFGMSCLRVLSFLADWVLETSERKNPAKGGHRPQLRRGLLLLGTATFSYDLVLLYHDLTAHSVRDNLSDMAATAGFNVVWPDHPTALDGALDAYSDARWNAFKLKLASVLCFACSLLVDGVIRRRWGLALSRILGFVGLAVVFANVIAPGLPNYIAAANLGESCPSCAPKFDALSRRVLGTIIGGVFGGIFTVSLSAVLVGAVAGLGRALYLMRSVEMERNRQSAAKILGWCLVAGSCLTPLVTGLPYALLYQADGDKMLLWLIIVAMALPAFLSFFVRGIASYWVWMFIGNMGPLIAIAIYEASKHGQLERLREYVLTFEFILSLVIEICIGAVTLADLVFMVTP